MLCIVFHVVTVIAYTSERLEGDYGHALACTSAAFETDPVGLPKLNISTPPPTLWSGQREMRLIFKLGTLRPNGLNINFNFLCLGPPRITHTCIYTMVFLSQHVFVYLVVRARTFRACVRVQFFVWRSSIITATEEGLSPKRLVYGTNLTLS